MMLRQNNILLFIFLLLSMYVYFFETGSKEKVNPGQETRRILDFDPENIEEIIFKTRDETLRFKKEDQHWQIISPIKSNTKGSSIDSLLSVFDFPIIRVINSDPSDLGEFGLDNPEVELGMRIKGEGFFKTLQVGHNSPRGLSCYAKLKEKPEVFLVGIIYKTRLERKLNSFMQ